MSQKKVALITGSGSRRVGRAVAQLFAKKGFSIAVHYRHSQNEATEAVADLRRQGNDAEAFQADLTQESAVADMVASVLKRFGQIDALVTCASTWSPKRLEDITADDVKAFFEANTLSTFLCVQRVGLQMVQQSQGGSIVTVGDWATIRPYANYAAYFPSKGAIPSLTRVFAMELAERNPRVRVNCVAPGPVMLPDSLPPHERERSIRGTLVKREGRPENVALAAMHFIENDFVTGTCLPVDGGRSIYAFEAYE